MSVIKKQLITGGDDPLLPHLLSAMQKANTIEIAVAFIKVTGLKLIFDVLEDALQTPNNTPPAIRIITTDYLNVTDPQALRMLMLLQERGADIRVFQAKGQSFHMKAYILLEMSGADNPLENVEGEIFIGSSNLSKAALTDGLEWNYRIIADGEEGTTAQVDEFRQNFKTLFNHKKSIPLNHDWIGQYELQRKVVPITVAEPGADEREPPPLPNPVQNTALDKLHETRVLGYRRGLVVMATGLGKTWLAAFDADQLGAKRILFVAHREEILLQAEKTFVRIMPHMRIGHYRNNAKDSQVDILCASIQTLGKETHLEKFSSRNFDYIVVDEFHHAAAPTYTRLLKHFTPKFLLGLTATPDRSDRSDILSLCDDNLVFEYNLFNGIHSKLLAPFHYYGIFDESVDYQEIPWRTNQFDPKLLSNKLATLGRAKHALKVWKEKALKCTLAFCVSRKHADFMAEKFRGWGVKAEAIHGQSSVSRTQGLERLASGELDIIFSVDLFNEGVDLPTIDTVMMLRPTESKILFLQQLGRGLRRCEGKAHLVVLDFIANHRGFLNKPQSLFGIDSTHNALSKFAGQVKSGTLELPAGCFVNYPLQFIEFLEQLGSTGPEDDYYRLAASLNHRPTIVEFYRAGYSIAKVREQYGSWFGFLSYLATIPQNEIDSAGRHKALLLELEKMTFTKCFKLVLLEAWLELDGLSQAITTKALAEKSFEVLSRRPQLMHEIPAQFHEAEIDLWEGYWEQNAINPWLETTPQKSAFFELNDHVFTPTFAVRPEDSLTLEAQIKELVDYRFSKYGVNAAPQPIQAPADALVPVTQLPYFPNIKIACGHFKEGNAEAEEYRAVPDRLCHLDSSRYFIAQASGHSMNGGKSPVRDGDYLVLERITPTSAGSLQNQTIALERVNESGDGEYLLRRVKKQSDGQYVLLATNPDYDDLVADDGIRTFARLHSVVSELEMSVGVSFMREDIPRLFNAEFNPGKWNSGYVSIPQAKALVLLVTINKQGKAAEHKYHDYFDENGRFHWQSQNATTPGVKKGKEIIHHEKMGLSVYLFVREHKLAAGKAAPFVNKGQLEYLSHEGEKPMNVLWKLL